MRNGHTNDRDFRARIGIFLPNNLSSTSGTVLVSDSTVSNINYMGRANGTVEIGGAINSTFANSAANILLIEDGSSRFRGRMLIRPTSANGELAIVKGGGTNFEIISDTNDTTLGTGNQKDLFFRTNNINRVLIDGTNGTVEVGGTLGTDPAIELKQTGDIISTVNNRASMRSECSTTMYGHTVSGPKGDAPTPLNTKGWAFNTRLTGSSNEGFFSVGSDGAVYIAGNQGTNSDAHRLDVANTGANIILRADGSADFHERSELMRLLIQPTGLPNIFHFAR